MTEQIAVLAGGCFWCTEAVFLDVVGVKSVESGYTGGHISNPTYKQVCGGDTGHAEAIRVTFDSDQLSYDDLLDIFFAIHDPTQLNRQGNDVGTQYRSAIFPADDDRREAAMAAIARANAARSAPKPRYDEAEQQYQLAAQIAPDDARAFAGLGNVYVDQGKFAQAVDAYQKAIKVKPDYNGAYLPLAFSLARLDRYPEAIDVYKEALKRDSTSPEIYNNLSFAYNHTGRFDDAVQSSKQAIDLLGETGEAYKMGFQERNEIRSYAYKNLGNAYNGLKKYDEAANALKKSSEIEPTNAAAHFNLGLTLYNAGRYSEAIESYKEVIKLRPKLAQAYFNLGLAYYAINDKPAALAQYETLKGLDADMAKQLYDAIKR